MGIEISPDDIKAKYKLQAFKGQQRGNNEELIEAINQINLNLEEFAHTMEQLAQNLRMLTQQIQQSNIERRTINEYLTRQLQLRNQILIQRDPQQSLNFEDDQLLFQNRYGLQEIIQLRTRHENAQSNRLRYIEAYGQIIERQQTDQQLEAKTQIKDKKGFSSVISNFVSTVFSDIVQWIHITTM